MSNQVATKDKEYNLGGHKASHNDIRGLLNQFWNLIDLPHHHEMQEMEPKIEVAENKNNVEVTAELPGVAEDDIDVEISSDGYLTISGEKRHETENEQKGSYFSEITYGMVKRTIPLPWDLQLDKADAEYVDGMLKISIPKSAVEQQKRKRISVSRNKKKDIKQ